MGIKGLTTLLSEHAPKAIQHHEIKTLFGRKVAIDASMSIYQFLIAVRQKDGEMLTNDAGETTSHLMGLFYRTIRIVENGIKPAYVFDGKPPDLKAGVLSKRFERRAEAKEDNEEAKETGTVEEMDKFSRRTVKVTREHKKSVEDYSNSWESLLLLLPPKRRLNVQNSPEEERSMLPAQKIWTRSLSQPLFYTATSLFQRRKNSQLAKLISRRLWRAWRWICHNSLICVYYWAAIT
jgi:hypothetical protein